MIAKLRGIVDFIGEDHVIIDVNGVGYLVFASRRTLSMMPPVGGDAGLIIETHVREDHIHLYGFADHAEKQWFALLTTVQGVGAKVGLAILSVLSPTDLLRALASQDTTALCRAPGVGAKVATRIIGELKDKAAKLNLGPVAAPVAPAATSPQADKAEKADGKAKSSRKKVAAAEPATPEAPVIDDGAIMADAVSALVNLGYGRSEAFGAVGKAAQNAGENRNLDTLIRLGLKELSA
ncbi:Holliday junction branch migration protein RuvA [Thalassospira marina]|uniref:Holliday junction branch migration complex subunit RuvA n=1 Tax=Thalassospira marina TaxID=2048283 RepID=A0ABN5FDH4_9PROT|nr:Holliday junction branch migration protein RuvA [Thalassospira marina]AUG52473.1 Holliday junction branch migration protein RuvA [Thalassospira marina]